MLDFSNTIDISIFYLFLDSDEEESETEEDLEGKALGSDEDEVDEESVRYLEMLEATVSFFIYSMYLFLFHHRFTLIEKKHVNCCLAFLFLANRFYDLFIIVL